MARKEDPEEELLKVRGWASAGAKVFFTYVERATLLGVLYAITPDKVAIESNDLSVIVRGLSWQFAVLLVGSLAILGPALFTAALWAIRWLKGGLYSPVETTVRFLIILGIGMFSATGVATVVTGVARILGTLAE